MSDITLNIIVLAVLVIIGGGIFLFFRRKAGQDRQALCATAAERGWQVEELREPLAWGMRLISPGWKLEALSRSSGTEAGPGSTNIAMNTSWHADAPGESLFIGTRTGGSLPGSLGSALAQKALQLALGPDAAGLKEVTAGSEAFRQRYMVWARQPAEVETALTPAVQAALLAWRGQPLLVTRNAGGLEIQLRGVRLKKTADVLKLVGLGEALLAELR